MADVIFQIGDLVVLKSGGPTMTVEDPWIGDRGIQCAWFDNIGHKQTGHFKPDVLATSKKEDSKDTSFAWG